MEKADVDVAPQSQRPDLLADRQSSTAPQRGTVPGKGKAPVKTLRTKKTKPINVATNSAAAGTAAETLH